MNKKILHTDKEVRIAFDPYRGKILEVFFTYKEPMTSKRVADILHEPPSKINYHMKQLESIDILHLDHTENINGILAKFYVMPYDTISMPRDEINPNVRRNALKTIVETNYHIGVNRFEQDIETGRDLYEKTDSESSFRLGVAYLPIYIKDEDYDDIVKRLFDILEPYREQKEGYNEYKVLMANVKTTNASKAK